MNDRTNSSPAEQELNETLDIQQIQAILPHRYPFLLIDRVIHLTRKQRVVAIKNVTINEPYFQGHFPSAAIMPGVLVVEAMAQAGGVLLLSEFPNREEKLLLFTGIENAKFRKPVTPGDQLRIEVDVLRWRRIAGRMQGMAYVGDQLVCEAIISCFLVDREPKKAEAAAPAESTVEQA